MHQIQRVMVAHELPKLDLEKNLGTGEHTGIPGDIVRSPQNLRGGHGSKGVRGTENDKFVLPSMIITVHYWYGVHQRCLANDDRSSNHGPWIYNVPRASDMARQMACGVFKVAIPPTHGYLRHSPDVQGTTYIE